jgi:anti-sigma regulatory factor (Ser/Thr protein kinase)
MEIAANPSLLCAVRGMVRGYVEGFGFPKARIDEIVLAIDEACANSIRHAYGGPCGRSYQLSMSSSNGWIEFEVRDDGKPAPKEALQRKAMPASEGKPPDIETIVPGGLGVQFIYGVFDAVEFVPGEREGNRVTMKLKRPPATT